MVDAGYMHEIPNNKPQTPDSYHIPAELDARHVTGTAHIARRPVPAQVHHAHPNTGSPRAVRLVQPRQPSVDFDRRILERDHNASAENVRHLRNLIRERYALDLEVWGQRNTHKVNRKIIMPKCERADSILQKIYSIVNSWDQEYFVAEEYELVLKIKECLQTKELENGVSNDAAEWTKIPPWERRDEVNKY